MGKSVKLFIACLIVTCLLAGYSEAAETKVYQMKIAHVTTTESSHYAGATKYKELLEASGRFAVQLFPNGQLGSDADGLQALQNGDIQMYVTGVGAISPFVPALVIYDLPFAIDNLENARKVLVDKDFFDAMQTAYEKSAFHCMGYSDMGFRQLSLNKLVQTPDDLEGQIVRTMENKFHMAVWRALGANPTPITYNELYTALQQGTADGQENPYEVTYTGKFYEQQKYIIETNHIYHCCAWLVNNDFYQSLDEEAKQILQDVSVKAIQYANDFSDASVARFREEMEKSGVQIVPIPEENKKLFVDKAQTVYAEIREAAEPNSFAAFEAAVEKLEK